MARNLYAEVTARILAELKAGALPWVKPWSGYAGPSIPANGSTGRAYSGCNVVLLWMAQQASGYTSPRWMTFKQGLELGAGVRKGERGEKVYFVSTFEREDTDTGEARRIPFLKEYTVFNVAQFDNLPARVLEGQAPKIQHTDERDATIDEFVAATGADVRHGEGRAYYRSSADFVMMPEFGTFTSAASYYATLFHELGHWSGAEKRLDRKLGNRFGSKAYAAEELIAELTAAFLCAEFQIDGEQRHAGYIESWISLLESDERAFFTAASAAQKAADHLRGLALAEQTPAPQAAAEAAPIAPTAPVAVPAFIAAAAAPAAQLSLF